MRNDEERKRDYHLCNGELTLDEWVQWADEVELASIHLYPGWICRSEKGAPGWTHNRMTDEEKEELLRLLVGKVRIM